MKKKLSIVLSIMLVSILLVGCGSKGVNLDKYPEQPVTSVVPWSVGGGADLVFRAVANYFPQYADDQTMLISNLEGAASVQGVTEYTTMNADGYNLVTWGTAQTIKTHMQETAYWVTDFEPVGSFVSDSPYILVRTDSGFDTLEDLINYAKENPGELTMGNSGAGGGNHLAAIQFEMAAGIEVNHIAYDGGGASSQGTLGGEVDCSMNMPAEGIASVEAGDLKMLAIMSEGRSDFFPDVPTAKEQGVDVVNEQMRGILVHKDAPEGVAGKLEEIFAELAKDTGFQDSVKELNMNFDYKNAADYKAALKAEDELYKGIIQDAGLGDRY